MVTASVGIVFSRFGELALPKKLPASQSPVNEHIAALDETLYKVCIDYSLAVVLLWGT